ncbi:PEP-CTERM sorting domain-containing protein [Neorhodopirellula lusitana]|uniref:PEP-CTERM sorting domain-containing protein n=1 Tax=Neorhodopirellula lusitana TaxID=445327 RepID=UPI00384BB863
MHCIINRAFVCALLLGSLVSASVSAEVFIPNSSVDGIDGDVFGWTRGDANSTYSGWDIFEGRNAEGNAFKDSTPDIGLIGNASTIGVGPGSIYTGSGNIYSPFAPLSFTGTAASGTDDGSFTRIVAQIRAGSTAIDQNSLLMNIGGSQTAPSLFLETEGLPASPAAPAGTPPGRDYLALWDINGTASGYDFAFDSVGSSFTLAEMHIDTFVSDTAFVTPSAVPEPSAMVATLFAGSGLLLRRRRKRRVGVNA